MILISLTYFQIALLHGPPGTGKTLTAEAVAEHLKRPLYVLSSLELSTTPATLEKKLGDILRVRKNLC
jgi:MoxR-like ATPase